MSRRITKVIELTAFAVLVVLVLLWAWTQNGNYEPWTAVCTVVAGGLEIYRRFFIKEEVQSGDSSANPLAKLEEAVPELLGEIRKDLKDKPLWREAVLMKKTWIFNGPNIFQYYYDDHENLAAKFQILENHGMISQVGFDVATPIYRFSETLVESLTKDQNP
jgi:hypothetical protein